MGEQRSLEDIRKRTIYRACHRGTKELDWLLGHFVTETAAELSIDQLLLIDRLMANPDPLIENWIMGRVKVSDTEFTNLISDIRSFHKL